MLKLACPACGAQVNFASGGSVFAVCAYCKAMLVRNDLALENLGKQAALKQDMSPLQLGAGGVVGRTPFSVIGRVQVKWSDGFWNEWCLGMADGRTGWLADAQGYYLVTFPVELPAKIGDADSFRPGAHLTIGKVDYEVDDTRECEVIASEGELPFRAEHGKTYTSVDFVGPDEAAASLSFTEDGVEGYVGKYYDFEELKLSNLRQFDGL